MFYIVRHGHRHDHGSLPERKSVTVSYDPQLTDIGQWMAFKTGMEIMEEIGRDKQIMFISSPFYRCLQTSEFMLCGMMSKETNVYNKQIYVEELVREHAVPSNFTLEDYKNLAFFNGEKHTHLETVYNSLEFFKGYDKLLTCYPEDDLSLIERTDIFLNKVAKFAKQNPDVVPVITTHGFTITATHQMFGKSNEKIVPAYCGVCKFEVDQETEELKPVYINKRFY